MIDLLSYKNLIINNMSIEESKKIYCIGIGGVGLSALAQLFVDKGISVSGSDRSESPVTEMLSSQGVDVHIDEEIHISDDCDICVYSIAIDDNHPDRVRARELGIKEMTYPEALGEVSKEYYTIAVAGTHGKTTTTGMIADILIDGGLEPTVIVGSMLKKYNSNYIKGSGDILVVEACEYRESFLNLNPDMIVITNIDEDHLDYYKDLDHIKDSFKKFISKLDQKGTIVCDFCNDIVADVVSESLAHIEDYSLVTLPKSPGVPGEHNIQNAKAAFAVSSLLSVPDNISGDSIASFESTWRRLEEKGRMDSGTLVIDDYAHHPTEVRATLSALKEKVGENMLVVVFQPHLYSRTKIFYKEFADALNIADSIVLLPIYAAREKEDKSISSEMIADLIEEDKVVLVDSLDSTVGKIKELGLSKDDIVVTMGAGDVYLVGEKLV